MDPVRSNNGPRYKHLADQPAAGPRDLLAAMANAAVARRLTARVGRHHALTA